MKQTKAAQTEPVQQGLKRNANGVRIYDETINMVIGIDYIANKLFKAFSPTHPHAALLTEAIIGTGMQSNSLHHIYNALHGFTGMIDFEVSDIVYSSILRYDYVKGEDGRYRKEEKEMGVCRIVDIDVFKDASVLVEFNKTDSMGDVDKTTSWVSHTMLRVPTIQEEEAAGMFREEESFVDKMKDALEIRK
jgi:hypothetical protein